MKGGSIALIGANIITMDKKDSRAHALLIQDGRIRAVGEDSEITKAAKVQDIPVTDLKGKTVLPGLHDCHVHVMGTGMAVLGADLYDCTSVAEVLDELKKEAKKSTDGWICGIRLDESRLAEKRPPMLKELSAVFPDRGVYLVDRGLHYTVINRKAYEEIGLSGQEKGLGVDEQGEPSGRMHEEANSIVRGYFNANLTNAQRRQAIQSVEQEALRQGITTIHAMEGGEMFSDADIPVFLELDGKTDVDFVLYWDTKDIDQVVNAGLKRIGTDILSDGSIGSRTAAFDEPYADDRETCGLMYIHREEMTKLIEKAFQNKLQFGFHAIGQQAIRQVLDCYEEVAAKYDWDDPRFRIEHFGFCDEKDIDRAARDGVIISTQPSFSYLRGGPGSVYQIRTGEDRERKAYPNRTFVEKGIVVAGGSDSNVTPMNAVLGIHAAVNHPYPEHRTSVYQALKMFTIDGAYSGLEEENKGSIECGKYGDLTVLSDSPYDVPSDRICDISVEMTIKEGRIVYKR